MAKDPDLVFVPTQDLWNWVDVGAYIEAVRAAISRRVEMAIRESGGDLFPYAVGETASVGLFQQSGRGWGR